VVVSGKFAVFRASQLMVGASLSSYHEGCWQSHHPFLDGLGAQSTALATVTHSLDDSEEIPLETLGVVVHLVRVVGSLSFGILVNGNLTIQMRLTKSLFNSLLESSLVESSVCFPYGGAYSESFLFSVRVAAIYNFFQVSGSFLNHSDFKLLLAFFLIHFTPDITSNVIIFLELRKHLCSIIFALLAQTFMGWFVYPSWLLFI